MAKAADVGQYVVLPPSGLRAQRANSTTEVRAFFASLPEPGQLQVLGSGRGRTDVRVLDSLGPEGARLVEGSPEAVLALRRLEPGVRVVPVRYYRPAVVRHEVVTPASIRPQAPGSPMRLRVLSKKTGKPVVGALVVAILDYDRMVGDQAVTDVKGEARLTLGGQSVTVDRLFVYPEDSYWSLMRRDFSVTDGVTVKLQPLDLAYRDGLRHFYGNPSATAGSGVTVAVIDTGVSQHADLVVAGGANTVSGEDPEDYGDNGHHHGTHVAGIIAARGKPPKGIRGVAPGVTLRAYRVFGQGSGSASSFAIAKAIDQAVADRCDLINMSLGGSRPDDVLKAAVESARAGGSVCIIAAGNSYRAPVGFPAAEAMAIAVSALGRKRTFPSGTAATADVVGPYGRDKADFIAAFSNVGPEIDLTGPGLAIISTVPGGYAELSGTSMACPAVTGSAARTLASSAGVLKMKRDANRAAAIAKAVLASARSLGFSANLEGHGLPR